MVVGQKHKGSLVTICDSQLQQLHVFIVYLTAPFVSMINAE
jgi:hypothetical protein